MKHIFLSVHGLIPQLHHTLINCSAGSLRAASRIFWATNSGVSGMIPAGGLRRTCCFPSECFSKSVSVRIDQDINRPEVVISSRYYLFNLNSISHIGRDGQRLVTLLT
jgi:hypothetical protein